MDTPNRFKRTRDDHLRESASDYCELIDELVQIHGRARVGNIAARFEVSPVTVTKTLKRLQREGYVKVEPYQGVTLTDMGHAIAEESRERHKLVLGLLVSLGISEATAELDAEGIEHHVSQETLDAFRKFLKQSQ